MQSFLTYIFPLDSQYIHSTIFSSQSSLLSPPGPPVRRNDAPITIVPQPVVLRRRRPWQQHHGSSNDRLKIDANRIRHQRRRGRGRLPRIRMQRKTRWNFQPTAIATASRIHYEYAFTVLPPFDARGGSLTHRLAAATMHQPSNYNGGCMGT